MFLDTHKLLKLSKIKGLSLNNLLKKAGISKTAYYNLANKKQILPDTILQLAKTLDIPSKDLLGFHSQTEEQIFHLQNKLELICREYKNIDRENVWHTLLLLEEPPIERLNRALRRGKATNYEFTN